MKLFSATNVTAALACALLMSAPSVSAESLRKSNHRHVVVHTHRAANKVVVSRAAPIRTVAIASAVSMKSLPVGYVRFLHGDEMFYYNEGVYYTKKPSGFVVVKPRAGFRVAALPSGYRTIRDRGVTFYSFNKIRYRKLDGFFVVV